MVWAKHTKEKKWIWGELNLYGKVQDDYSRIKQIHNRSIPLKISHVPIQSKKKRNNNKICKEWR